MRSVTTPPPPDKRCSADIHHSAWNTTRCRRKGTIEEDGKLWCSQHAPSRAAERRRALDEAAEAKRKERRRLQEQYEWDRVIMKVGAHDKELAAQLHRFAIRHDILD